MLSIAGKHAIVGAEEDDDELDRDAAAGHEQSARERHEPPGVVAAEAAVDHVEAALPPVRQQRQPTQPLGVEPFRFVFFFWERNV